MKCQYCNASLTLEDEFCPYCGALNEPAREHIAAMKRYHADYQNTRQEVLRNVNQQSRKHSKILAIVILVALNCILFALHSNIYLFQGLRDEWHVRSHAQEYRAVLDNYESEGKYAELNRFYSQNLLYSTEELREYDAVSDMASQYTRVCDNLYYFYFDVDNYQTKGELLQRVSQYVRYFYDIMGEKERSSYHPERFAPVHMAAMEDMENKLCAQLIAYCGLNEEDIEKLPDMESQEIFLLLGRRSGYYE